MVSLLVDLEGFSLRLRVETAPDPKVMILKLLSREAQLFVGWVTLPLTHPTNIVISDKSDTV